jgi:hypothetical protein
MLKKGIPRLVVRPNQVKFQRYGVESCGDN